MPKKKTKPTLTEQIAALNERKGSTQNAINSVKQRQSTYQERLDKAQDNLADALTESDAMNTAESRDKVSDLRVEKHRIRNEFEQSTEDLKMLPERIKSINLDIRQLTSAKKELETKIIREHYTDAHIAELREKARASMIELSVAECMLSNRDPNFIAPNKVFAKLDKDRSVSAPFVSAFHEQQNNMDFEKL